MAKYLIMWETDMSRMPTDPKQQMEIVGKQLEMTKEALKARRISDWGLFAGGNKGYSISEGSAADVFMGTSQFSPYITFTVHPVLSADELSEAMKSMRP